MTGKSTAGREDFPPPASADAAAHSAWLRHLAGRIDEGGRVRPCPKALRRVADELDAFDYLLNSPEIEDFLDGVQREAGHQQLRWGAGHDARKEFPEWFWLVGYLAGKALAAWKQGDRAKVLHHIVTAAAACANWHRHAKALLPAEAPRMPEDGA